MREQKLIDMVLVRFILILGLLVLSWQRGFTFGSMGSSVDVRSFSPGSGNHLKVFGYAPQFGGYEQLDLKPTKTYSQAYFKMFLPMYVVGKNPRAYSQVRQSLLKLGRIQKVMRKLLKSKKDSNRQKAKVLSFAIENGIMKVQKLNQDFKVRKTGKGRIQKMVKYLQARRNSFTRVS